MKKENVYSIVNDNNIKKMILKKINESLIRNNLKKQIQIKKDNYIKKKINLSFNNNININLNNNTFHDIINPKIFDINNDNSNIYLGNNFTLYNDKKTRNLIKFNGKKENITPSRLKSIETFEIKFNNKIISKTEYKKSKNIKIFFVKNINDELIKNNNIKNKSYIEENGRKIFLNLNNKKKKLIEKDKKNIYTKYININNNYYNKRNIYSKIFFSKQNTKRNNYSENNSFFNKRNNKPNDNIWNSSTLEYSLLDRTNKYNNNSLIIKNNDNNFRNKNNNFMSLGNTYIRKGYTLSNRQKTFNNINTTKDVSHSDVKFKNNSINKTLEGNKIKQNNPSFIYIKNKINKKRKFYSCKSQENIYDNGNKYNLLIDGKNSLVLKKENYKYNYYNKNINEIIKIQKWWKDMIFHIYIEKKIIYIQRKYKIYLNNKRIRNNILFFFLKKIDKIILIQRTWKSYRQKKNIVNDKNKNLNYSHDDSYEKEIPKYIPFKLDNFEINSFSESLIATTKKVKGYNENNNNNNENKVYIKKNICERNNKIKKNNTVSHFYISKYRTYSYNKIKKYTIEKQVNNFFIKSKNKEININEKGIIKLVKNISFDINKIYNANNNIQNEILFHIPINSKCFIEKRHKSKIYKKSNKLDDNYYFTKIRKNKYYIIRNIVLIQNKFKKYINNNNNNIKKIKKVKSKICYIIKVKKIINKFDNSNHNPKISDDIFSFNGSYYKEKINKDRINEKEIINLKKERNNISNNNNLNLFSFDDNNNNQIIYNKDYILTNIQKLKKIFNKYFIFIIISNLRYIYNKNIIIIKSTNIINRIINIHLKKFIFEFLKKFYLDKNQNLYKNSSNEIILDHDEIDNKLNKIKYMKNKYSLISLKEIKKLENNIYINNNEELSNYIYNYFYNKKKFTNISIKLIKERLLKSPLIYNTQNDIINYMNDLYMDIMSNKICNICFCKYGEKYNDNCPCHINNNYNQKFENKNRISIYRQKMNKIINDMNKKRLNTIKIKDNNKININVIKNNDEYSNKKNFYEKYNFNIVDYIKQINNENDKNYNNNIFNRYETDSVHSRSRSKSK